MIAMGCGAAGDGLIIRPMPGRTAGDEHTLKGLTMASAVLTPSKSEAVQAPRSRGLSRVLALLVSRSSSTTSIGAISRSRRR